MSLKFELWEGGALCSLLSLSPSSSSEISRWQAAFVYFSIDYFYSAITRKVAWPRAQYLFAEKYFSVSFIHVFLVGGQLFLVFSICTLAVFMSASTLCMPALFRTNVCFCPKIYKQHDKNIYIFPGPEKQFYPIMESHSGGVSIYQHSIWILRTYIFT